MDNVGTISSRLRVAVAATILLTTAFLQVAVGFEFGSVPGVDAQLFELRSRQGEGQDLDRIVRSITTVAEYADGSTKSAVGGGFVVGSRYYTVHHNLTVRVPGVVRTTTYVEGVAVRATYINPSEDLAVIELPGKLCGRMCNADTLHRVPQVRSGQKVHWLRKVPGEYRWRSGEILGYAFLGGDWADVEVDADGACDSNVIVEVDTPFISGTSGAPVVDSETGQILGIVQGSIERDGQLSGFFKPIECAMRMVREQLVQK